MMNFKLRKFTYIAQHNRMIQLIKNLFIVSVSVKVFFKPLLIWFDALHLHHVSLILTVLLNLFSFVSYLLYFIVFVGFLIVVFQLELICECEVC